MLRLDPRRTVSADLPLHLLLLPGLDSMCHGKLSPPDPETSLWVRSHLQQLGDHDQPGKQPPGNSVLSYQACEPGANHKMPAMLTMSCSRDSRANLGSAGIPIRPFSTTDLCGEAWERPAAALLPQICNMLQAIQVLPRPNLHLAAWAVRSPFIAALVDFAQSNIIRYCQRPCCMVMGS